MRALLTAKLCSTESTLFVGDLPPYYQNEDLYNVFAQWGEIEEIRIMGAQCYAFVKFHSAEVAQSLAQRFSREPLTASGHELRINLAHGQLPAWKVCNREWKPRKPLHLVLILLLIRADTANMTAWHRLSACVPSWGILGNYERLHLDRL